MLRILTLTLPLILFSQAVCAADGVGKMNKFLNRTRSAQAFFTQEVLDKNGKVSHSANGVMQFQRPGRFRWTYQEPYEQIIVGDGKKFWMYDVDLNQVVIKKLDAALGSSPAALLAGSKDIKRDFDLRNVECEPPVITDSRTADGKNGEKETEAASQVAAEKQNVCSPEDAKLAWVEAKPKVPESFFADVRLAFNAKAHLVTMVLKDNLGHVTVLRFNEMQINPRLPIQLFQFDMPQGVEILEDQR